MLPGLRRLAGGLMMRPPADLQALPSAWRQEAELLRTRYGADELAALAESHARDLEAALASNLEEPLNLQEAGEESGYHPDTLGRMVRDGRIPNAGRPGSPAILRKDLPLKPGAPGPKKARSVAHETATVRSIESLTRSALSNRR